MVNSILANAEPTSQDRKRTLFDTADTPPLRRPQLISYIEAERDELQQLKSERDTRLAKRNLYKETFLGAEPVLESFYILIERLLPKKADQLLDHHLAAKWNRQYKDEVGPVFCDQYFRRNKVVRGLRVLRESDFSTLIESGLWRRVSKGSIWSGKADYYEPTELRRKLYSQCVTEACVGENFYNVKMIRPTDGRVINPPRNKMDGAPDSVKGFAAKVQKGRPQVNLTSIYSQFIKDSNEYQYIYDIPRKDWTEEQMKLIGRLESNMYNLLGIKINGYIRLEGGECLLRQAWGYTYPGRLKPLKGGFLNLCREYRQIGFLHSTRRVWVHDIKAAQVNIFLNEAEARGFTSLELDYYAANKSARRMYADMIGYGCTEDIVKTGIISLCMGASVLNPAVVKRMVHTDGTKAFRKLKDYTFVWRFVKVGGLEAYYRAYAVLENIISFVQTVRSVIYNRSRDSADTQLNSNCRYVTNAVGARIALWDAKGKPLDGKSKAETERELMAFILQGAEQEIVHRVAVDIEAYEHDGWVSATRTEYKQGRIEIESVVYGAEGGEGRKQAGEESEGGARWAEIGRREEEEKERGERSLQSIVGSDLSNTYQERNTDDKPQSNRSSVTSPKSDPKSTDKSAAMFHISLSPPSATPSKPPKRQFKQLRTPEQRLQMQKAEKLEAKRREYWYQWGRGNDFPFGKDFDYSTM